MIYDNVDPDANIIFGALVDDKIDNGEVRESPSCIFWVLGADLIGQIGLPRLLQQETVSWN